MVQAREDEAVGRKRYWLQDSYGEVMRTMYSDYETLGGVQVHIDANRAIIKDLDFQ